MEFWNSQLTEKSWEILKEIRKKYDFILIGGWAAYLWTKQQKSKDVDIVVSIEELQKLKAEHLIKNERLKKYEIKYDNIDVDIYVSHFSKLALPAEDIKDYVSEIEGFKVASKESLLVLKQGAEIERGNSIKGEKDRIDIISLLFFSDLDLKKYAQIIKKYSKEDYLNRLLFLLRGFRDFNALKMTPKQLKMNKEKILKELRSI